MIKFEPLVIERVDEGAYKPQTFTASGKDGILINYVKLGALRDRIIAGKEGGTRWFMLTDNDREVLCYFIEGCLVAFKEELEQAQKQEEVERKNLAEMYSTLYKEKVKLEEELRIANEKLTEDINA